MTAPDARAPGSSGAMCWPLHGTVFALGEHRVTWDDLWSHGQASGVWRKVAGEVAAGRAAVRAAPPGVPATAVMQAAEADFRYARNLVAAAELEDWLDRWGISLVDWRGYLRRTVLREADTRSTPSAGADPGEEDGGRLLWPTAVCSGAVAEVAVELAGLVAVQHRLVEEGCPVPEDLRAAHEAFVRRLTTDDALARVVRSRVLEWTRIDGDELALPGEQAAREALLLLRDDGLSTAEVAQLAAVPASRRMFRVEDALPEHRPSLVAAVPGDVLGPVRGENAFRLLVVRDKLAPSLQDADVRERAVRALVERSVQREIDERVVWHVEL